MNLLNSIFDFDKIEIYRINKKYMILIAFLLLILIILLSFKKNFYYINTFSNSDNEIILLVDKDSVSMVKKASKILIDDVEISFSINKITPVDNILMVYVTLSSKIENRNNGIYKVYLGKESLFNYIVRIIEK